MAFPSPRSWEFAHRALQKFGDHPELLAGALTACVGQAAGIECAAFVDSLDRLPDLDAICAGQRSGRADRDRPAIRRRRRTGRPRTAGEEHAGSARPSGATSSTTRSASRKEMGVMLVSDMHRGIGQALFAVPQFSGVGECGGRILDVV